MERVDLRSLLTRGIPLEEQFNKLVDDSEELLPFLEELRPWLKECVEFGRFLVDPSPERRALQGRVDFWTSRLSQSGVWEGDIDRIADFDPTAGIPLDRVCPYPGLEPYTPDRRASFFGREALIASYVAHLQDQSRRILLIIGASGSGKSSLALAGVVPKLQERHTDAWLFAPRLAPGAQPLAALAASVAEAIEAPAQAEEIARSLAAKPDEALTQFAALCRGKPLMLLIDQFEELLTLCRDPAEQKAFADVLFALSVPDSSAEGFSCRILLTLRTDHLARFESSDGLKPLHTRLVGENNDRYLAAIGFDDIKRAIAEPAKQVGLRVVPPTLIDRLASQTHGLANGLPLLQYALRRLWDTRPVNAAGQPLDLVNEQMMDALPDVQRALGRVADDIFQTFSEEQKRICERLLQELVVLDETFEEPLRRRRNEAQLLAVLEARFSAAFAGAAEVIERFVNAGLLRRFGEGQERQLEVAHEALLRHWPHINQLLSGEQAKDRLHLIKQIGREAAEWASHGRTDGYLTLRGERLKGALNYAKDRWLDEAESADYVRACNDREEEEKRRDEEAREQGRRVEEAQRAAEQAEKREAIAKARQKQSQLWLVISLATLAIVFGGAAFSISKERDALQRIETSREASLSAFAAHAASLPPWEGLDVAYTAARHGGTALRFALAHALERMEDTWLLGSERTNGLALNRDGSTLFQFDGAKQSLHLYPVGRDGKPDKPITIALPGRLDSLANPQNNIGPPINGKSNERLVLLFFRDAKGGPGYLVEAHHVSAERQDPPNTFTLPAQAEAPAISAIDFQADGKGAVFSAINYGTLSSTIYRLTWDSVSKGALLPVDDPVKGEKSARSVISAVAFGADAGGSTAALITGRLDGSVYCDTKALTSASADAVSDPSPVRQIVTLSASDTFVVVHASGSMYAGSCASGTKARVDTQGNAASVALTRMPKDKRLLTYLDGTQLHCLVPVDKQKNQWVERFCNPSHPVGTSVPLQGGHQVTAEMGRSAVHAYPVEVLAARDRLVGARRAGSTVVRWKLPVSAAENDRRLLPTSDPSDKDLPWKSESHNTWAAGTDERLITFAALSPEGKQIVWIEQRQTASHTDWLADLASQEKISLVVRTWTIGSDSLARRVPNQPGQAVIAAISNDGVVAYGQTPFARPAEIYLNETRIDRVGPTDSVVACLAFSRNGRWLVAGTGAGKVWAYELQQDGRDGMATVPKAPTSWVEPFTTETDKRPRRITSCAVGDDGVLIIVGNSEGQVVLRQPSGTWQDLTERAAFQFSAPVKAVTIDPDGRHVAALADWQPNGCSRPGLPGQALHVWDVTLPDIPDKSWPVANACFPNQIVLAIGDLDRDQQGSPSIPLVTARDIRWHACPGCAREREIPEEMLERLLRDAAQKAKAQRLDPETLNTRYGMRFQ